MNKAFILLAQTSANIYSSKARGKKTKVKFYVLLSKHCQNLRIHLHFHFIREFKNPFQHSQMESLRTKQKYNPNGEFE